MIDIKFPRHDPAYIPVITALFTTTRATAPTNNMKKLTILLALASALSATGVAHAQETQQSPWLIRLRAVDVTPDNKSAPIGGSGSPDRLSVSSKTIPEADISYFFTANWSTELILTYPQKHTVSLDGSSIGTFKELPPTLLLQYHFTPSATWSPYLGLGINYTRISNVNLANGADTLQGHSFGPAIQAGIDYKIDDHWLINFDIKKVQLRSNVYASGTQVSAVHIDPWLIGFGVGYRF